MEIPERLHWNVPYAEGPIRWADIPGRQLVATTDGGPAEQATLVRAAWNEQALSVRFECEDRDAWGTLTRRDDPLYQEEAVEVFLAPGTADPTVYFEFEVSPRGVLWDGRIHNPTSRRADLVSDATWDCPGIRWQAGAGSERQDWWAELVIPWEGVVPGVSPLPVFWRASFYRIERPAGSPPEFTAWSPTLVTPADFHKPARFGVLKLER